jgi:hypothetical protein
MLLGATARARWLTSTTNQADDVDRYSRGRMGRLDADRSGLTVAPSF